MEGSWPIVDGNFVVGRPDAPVAVCTLTTENLHPQLAALSGVAIAGQVYTANLGIERIIRNVTANPSIRFLLLCGKESKLFRPGQSLSALVEEGIDGDARILGAEGYEPVLPNVSRASIDSFRQQIELVDWTGEDDPAALEEQIDGLVSRNPGLFTEGQGTAALERERVSSQHSVVPIRPGGRRQPLQYDPKGYFVITIDREEEQIVLQHYLPDHTPAHEMRGRVAESMLLGLLREDLISQLSHAGYLGGELAKAEAALHLDLRYRQDRPLTRPPAPPPADLGADAETSQKPAPKISPAMSLDAFHAVSDGDEVDVVIAASEQPERDVLVGTLLQPTEKSPFGSFHRTGQPLTVHWSDQTRVIMGEPAEIVARGIFRVQGRRAQKRIEAGVIIVLTKVATVE